RRPSVRSTRTSAGREARAAPCESTSVRVAALYDIHGNLPALEAVLAEVAAEAVDLILVGGDVASGPMPAETLARLQSLGARFVRGNADRVLDVVGGAGGDAEVGHRGRLWVAGRRAVEPFRVVGR